MDTNKTACNCHNVRYQKIIDAVKAGADTYEKLQEACENGTVMSGGQIDEGLPVSNILSTYRQKNGTAFAIDNLIQAPQKSVYKVLRDNEAFTEYVRLLDGFGNDELFWFASDRMREKNNLTKKTRRDGYLVFVNEAGHYGLDYDVKFFNSYNYTVYVPDNEAMQRAYDLGLPTWDDIQKIYDNINYFTFSI